MEQSLETLRHCPSCAHDSFNSVLNCTDHTYSRASFDLVECSNCHLLFTNPRPDENTIGKYYDNPEYVSHTDTKSGLLFTLYGLVKRFTLKHKRRFLEHLSKEKSMLDYGAGSGDFSIELIENGWEVSAFEPDTNARQKIILKNSQLTVVNNLTELASESKAIITLWHVLEHVHRLDNTIEEFHRILKPEGLLVIAVPNHTSYDAQFYGPKWAAYDVPRHLYHFSPETLKKLMSDRGFQLQKIKPMWFDSFYVSLLSEKNINSSSALGWIRAFCIGLLSNIKTINSTENCSSITYIFKKGE